MRILVCGDTHGHSRVVKYKLDIAKRLGATHILVVGDFGVWPGIGGVQFLDEINAHALFLDIKIYALPGNHEDHDQWEWWLNSNIPKDNQGFTYIRSNVLISPKVHNWKWDHKRFFIAGGAVSIDKQRRIKGKDWWSNEVLSDSEFASIQKYQGPAIDYLFTHDCSDFTPWGFHLDPDPASQAHRQRIDQVIRTVRPRMQFHGHMHHKYDWINTASHYGNKETLTYGLDCDSESNSWGVLDTERDRFFWPLQADAAFSPTLNSNLPL